MQARDPPESEVIPKPLLHSLRASQALQAKTAQGARLVALRKAAALSQAELARLIGEPQQNVALWEQSDKPPRSDAIPKLARALGVQVEDVFTDKATPSRRSGPVGKVRKLFDEVSKLPRRQQDRIVEFLSPIVEEFKRKNRLSMSGWTAILPLVGVAVGALLQFWLSRSAEARKQLELIRSQAHVDYLRAVAKAAHAGSPEARRAAVADAADAKARIAVYGSASVVHALARFEEAGPALDNARSTGCFLTLVSAMRENAGDASPLDLELVLIGPRAAAAQRALPASSEPP